MLSVSQCNINSEPPANVSAIYLCNMPRSQRYERTHGRTPQINWLLHATPNDEAKASVLSNVFHVRTCYSLRFHRPIANAVSHFVTTIYRSKGSVELLNMPFMLTKSPSEYVDTEVQKEDISTGNNDPMVITGEHKKVSKPTVGYLT